MPKHDFMSPKAIGNRIKAKGLQKLRWYCQMCEKQCRDENGFKVRGNLHLACSARLTWCCMQCHCESESHRRQMKLFAENSSTYLDTFSRDFEASFMDILSRRFRSSRVWCNVVYQEVIADSGHIHMNSTKWETLTGFVKYLGTSGQAVVEEGMTPSGQPGFFLRYIVRDAEEMAKQERLKNKVQDEENEEERQSRMLRRQISKARAAANASGAAEAEHAATELHRKEGDPAAKVAFNMAAATESTAPRGKPAGISLASFGAEASSGSVGSSGGHKRKRTAMDEIMDKEQRKKQIASESQALANRTDWWLQPGIVVKVINKKLKGGKYHKKKGVVENVKEQYVGEVCMIDTGHVLRLDQVRQVQTAKSPKKKAAQNAEWIC